MQQQHLDGSLVQKLLRVEAELLSGLEEVVFGVVMQDLRQPQQRTVELELEPAPETVLALIAVFLNPLALSRAPPARPCGVPRDRDVVS